MIKRIVKMHFKPEEVDTFLQVYQSSFRLIAGFEGCLHVELLRDHNNPAVFFTYSRWKGVEHLEKYRQSDLFKGVWARTKVLFEEKAQAWTVDELQFT